VLFEMAEVTLELIKKLRSKTGVGIGDCKKALIEAEGDIEEAAILLRKKGMALAAKRSGNLTEHGIIEGFVSDDYTTSSLIELACETDFAANTKDMRNFASTLTKESSNAKKMIESAEELLGLSVNGTDLNIQSMLDELISKIAEKIIVSRTASFRTDDTGLTNLYIHPGSLLGVVILLKADKAFSGEAREKIAALAKDICMQAAVTNPRSISSDSLDKAVLDAEMSVARAQLVASGKPEAIIDKILLGKANKFYEEVCLLNQKFIKDDKVSVQQKIEQTEKETGIKLTISDYNRFGIGG
jgi:elongation factor Ts